MSFSFSLQLTLALIVITFNVTSCNPSTVKSWSFSSVEPDFGKTPCELIESRDFQCETHYITTADGYILTAHRLINPILRAKGKTPIKPYVLQHGLFGSGVHFMINSPGGFADDWTEEPLDVDFNSEGRNLAFLLANHNYDVWVVNSRGNIYSKNHTTLDPKQDQLYWRFSFDQMIEFDTLSYIDYILDKTGSESLGWVGHSQGTLLMFGFLSQRPDYTDKVSPFVAMAPIAHVEHITSPIRLLVDIPGLMDFFFVVGGELTFPQVLLDAMAELVCGVSLIQEVCSSPMFLVCGYDAPQMNNTRMPVYMSQALGGTSAWDLLHFGQNIVNGKFLKFDYGSLGNLAAYGQIKPPAYDLGAIQSNSIILLASNNDPLSDPTDLEILRKSLKVPFTEFRIPDPLFSHLDFIWALNVYEQVYKPMLDLIKRYD